MKSIFRKTFSLLTAHEQRKFFTLVLYNTLICILDIAALGLLVLIIGFYTQGSTRYLSFLPAGLLDRSSISLVLLFFIFFLVKSLAGLLGHYMQFRYVYNVATRMAAHNLMCYFKGDYKNYINIPPATHIRHISDHTIQFGHYVLFAMYQVITEYILVAVTITCILLFNADLFLILLLLLLPPVLLAGYFTRYRLKNARAHVKQTSEASLQYLQEALNGFVEARVYNKVDFLLGRFSKQQHKFNRYLSDVHISQGLPTRLIELFAILGLLLLIAINNIGGAGDAVGIINIGAFMAVAYKLIPGVVKIANLSTQLKTYEFIVDDMQQAGLNNNEVPESDGPAINRIKFDKVTYAYDKHASPAVYDFEIPAGTFVGVSGNSGKGKTTLVNLLLGFVQPDEGVIEINDRQVTGNELHQFLHDISYVKQQPYLVQDSVLQNIVLRDDAVYNEKVAHVMKLAGVDKLVAQYPEGADKLVTDNGKNISGGQRQRIAIARALYKDTNVILLDEAFSELDHAAEQEFLQYFKQLAAAGKIVVMITHNKNSLSYCDMVIEL